jgi:hypothetical protein
MRHTACALGLIFVVAQACATVPPRPLALPPPAAPLEERVVAYQEHAAMPHLTFGGWAMRVGEGAVAELDDARPTLANAPEAEAILHDRDTQHALGIGLMIGGTAVAVGAALLPLFTLDDRDFSLTLPLSLITLGLGAEIAGVFIEAAAQRKVPVAAEAYNRWLWGALDLPRAGRRSRTPHPAAPPWTAAP